MYSRIVIRMCARAVLLYLRGYLFRNISGPWQTIPSTMRAISIFFFPRAVRFLWASRVSRTLFAILCACVYLFGNLRRAIAPFYHLLWMDGVASEYMCVCVLRCRHARHNNIIVDAQIAILKCVTIKRCVAPHAQFRRCALTYLTTPEVTNRGYCKHTLLGHEKSTKTRR